MVFLSPSNHFKGYFLKIGFCFYTFTFAIEICHFTNFIDILQCDSSFPSMTVRIHLPRDVLLGMNHIGLGYKPPVRGSHGVDPSIAFCVSSFETPSDLCHKLAVCDDGTVWRWSAALAQKC